jgi:hypothetical protein
MRTQRSDIENRPEWLASRAASEARGSMLHAFAEGRGCASVIGVPAPWQTWACLQALTERGFTCIEVDLDPPALAERDVNREAVRAFQLSLAPDPDAWLPGLAERWVGQAAAPALLAIWHASDRTVAAMPVLPLYGGLGFTWYRFWVRPFVPDIGKIPEAERAYYEDHCLTTFNNPHRVDLGADMLWEIHGQAECDRLRPQFDAAIQGPLVRALELARHAVDQHGPDTPTGAFFRETLERLQAYSHFAVTQRNIVAWIAGVHGYLEAGDAKEKQRRLSQVREMVASELENTRGLLQLWRTASVDFMAVHETAETTHMYGPNFGELLEKKIALMEKYGHHLPYIDPDYMWRMPEGSDLKLEDYIGYQKPKRAKADE